MFIGAIRAFQPWSLHTFDSCWLGCRVLSWITGLQLSLALYKPPSDFSCLLNQAWPISRKKSLAQSSNLLFAESSVLSCRTFLWGFLMGFSCGVFLWGFLVGFSYGVFLWGFLMGFSYGVFLWDFTDWQCQHHIIGLHFFGQLWLIPT